MLLVVVGSDLATMEAVSSYDRPLYGRVRLERVVLPLNLAEVADVLGLGAPDAVDPYLRFWLRFGGPALADVERGRVDLAVTRTEDGWPSYRGRAVEPLIPRAAGADARTRRGA